MRAPHVYSLKPRTSSLKTLKRSQIVTFANGTIRHNWTALFVRLIFGCVGRVTFALFAENRKRGLIVCLNIRLHSIVVKVV